MKRISTVLTAMMILLFNLPEAKGQQFWNAPKKKIDYSTKYLQRTKDLPGIPPYPGKDVRLLRAVELPNMGKGKITILQSFLVKDPPEQVRDYYCRSLTDNGWKSQSANKTNTQIVGRRPANESCQIMVYPPFPGSMSAGYKTMLQIRYTKAG